MKQTTVEVQKVINDFVEGKPIQYRAHDTDIWSGRCISPYWDFSKFEYREIPKHPCKCYMVITGDDTKDTVHLTKKEAVAKASPTDRIVIMEEIT